MKLTGTISPSVEADTQAELRHVERAVASGTREPGRGLKARQEQEAWSVLLACQGQLRLAPSGHVIGTDDRRPRRL
jgi:hypothetical protein